MMFLMSSTISFLNKNVCKVIIEKKKLNFIVFFFSFEKETFYIERKLKILIKIQQFNV